MGFLPLVEYQWSEAQHAGAIFRAVRSPGANAVRVTAARIVARGR